MGVNWVYKLMWIKTAPNSHYLWPSANNFLLNPFFIWKLLKFVIMKKLISTGYNDFSFNLALFILRIGLGVLMIPHGYDKLVHFMQYKKDFMNFLGLGSVVSLAIVVFAELFCSVFLIMGLFTRVIAALLIFEMLVVVFNAHQGQIFGDGEHGMLFLTGYIAILLLGPGKASLDGILGK
jgi:putative oxidoreductase